MFDRRYCGLLVLPLFLAALAVGQSETTLPAVKELKKIPPKESVFGAATRAKPLVLESKEDVAKYFGEEALAKLLEQVDFEKQKVLVFAWRGSGQDRLEVAVLESFPEQLVFTYKPGRTRDLRPHVYVYAVRENVKWSTKGAR